MFLNSGDTQVTKKKVIIKKIRDVPTQTNIIDQYFKDNKSILVV